MDEREIVKVVRKLIGNTSPIGETHYDDKVLAHIFLYIEVVDQLIMHIIDDVTLMSNYTRSLASVQNCREEMFEGLKKIKERIEECFEEEEVE